jgi:hypothetical protein
MSDLSPENYYDFVENPIEDLLNANIDETQNVLGNRWLERETFATIIGSSGIGKSVAAMQMAILFSAGLPAFGIKPPRPLTVVLVQSEDPRNDRIMQVQCIPNLCPSSEQRNLISKNLFIYTTNRRGQGLFAYLEGIFGKIDKEKKTIICDVDLFIFNPAFAFFDEGGSVEDSRDVGQFLRSEFQPFLVKMNAAGILVHHTPKLTHRDTSKWSTQTYMYSGHGSAEWTNAPRGVITIDGTNSPNVFEFRVAKRGYHNGWTPNAKGEFIRHFSHAPKGGPMHWIPSTEEDIAASQQESGLKDKDVLDLFSEDEPKLHPTAIAMKLKFNGFKFDQEELIKILDRVTQKRRLQKLGDSFVSAKQAKAEEKAAQAEQVATYKSEQESREREEVFNRIKESMPDGVIQKALTKKDAFSFGWRTVERYLGELKGRIRLEIIERGPVKIHRYFAI